MAKTIITRILADKDAADPSRFGEIVYKSASLQVCKSASLQVCESGLQVCESASLPRLLAKNARLSAPNQDPQR